jgi:hypothetical protein
LHLLLFQLLLLLLLLHLLLLLLAQPPQLQQLLRRQLWRLDLQRTIVSIQLRVEADQARLVYLSQARHLIKGQDRSCKSVCLLLGMPF